jgi:hypothetical protein
MGPCALECSAPELAWGAVSDVDAGELPGFAAVSCLVDEEFVVDDGTAATAAAALRVIEVAIAVASACMQ